jgi:hypothetical protein
MATYGVSGGSLRWAGTVTYSGSSGVEGPTVSWDMDASGTGNSSGNSADLVGAAFPIWLFTNIVSS